MNPDYVEGWRAHGDYMCDARELELSQPLLGRCLLLTAFFLLTGPSAVFLSAGLPLESFVLQIAGVGAALAVLGVLTTRAESLRWRTMRDEFDNEWRNRIPNGGIGPISEKR